MIYMCNTYNILSTDQRFFPAAVDQREQDRVHQGGHLRQPDFVEPSVSDLTLSITFIIVAVFMIITALDLTPLNEALLEQVQLKGLSPQFHHHSRNSFQCHCRHHHHHRHHRNYQHRHDDFLADHCTTTALRAFPMGLLAE